MRLRKRIKTVITGMLLMGIPAWFALPAQTGRTMSPFAVVTSSPPEDTVKTKVTVIDNHIIVTDAPVNSLVEIYNIVGVKVKEIEIKHPSEEYIVLLPKGYYIVRIEETVRKIVIR